MVTARRSQSDGQSPTVTGTSLRKSSSCGDVSLDLFQLRTLGVSWLDAGFFPVSSQALKLEPARKERIAESLLLLTKKECLIISDCSLARRISNTTFEIFKRQIIFSERRGQECAEGTTVTVMVIVTARSMRSMRSMRWGFYFP